MNTLIVTHAEGFLACFTKNGKDLKQQALINVGDHAPTALELATMGEEMASRFGWTNPIQVAPAKRALPPVKKKRKGKRPMTSSSEIAIRKEQILECVRQHGPISTRAALTEILGEEPDGHVESAWRHQFNALRRDGLIVGRSLSNRVILWEVA